MLCVAHFLMQKVLPIYCDHPTWIDVSHKHISINLIRSLKIYIKEWTELKWENILNKIHFDVMKLNSCGQWHNNPKTNLPNLSSNTSSQYTRKQSIESANVRIALAVTAFLFSHIIYLKFKFIAWLFLIHHTKSAIRNIRIDVMDLNYKCSNNLHLDSTHSRTCSYASTHIDRSAGQRHNFIYQFLVLYWSCINSFFWSLKLFETMNTLTGALLYAKTKKRCENKNCLGSV